MGIVDGAENRIAMQELFVFLAREFQIRNFVETGTYQGATARFASQHFARVVTIEGSESLHRSAKQQLLRCANIECLCGDSRHHLARIVRDLRGPTLFWLDAHWSGGETFGEQAECPIMDELSAIYENADEAFTLIDDARFFVSLPPVPHDITAWPTYFEIADTVRQRASETFITLYADAILLAPQHAAEKVIPYLRRPLPLPPKRRRFGWLSATFAERKGTTSDRKSA
jgi:hypothetical protein